MKNYVLLVIVGLFVSVSCTKKENDLSVKSSEIAETKIIENEDNPYFPLKSERIWHYRSRAVPVYDSLNTVDCDCEPEFSEDSLIHLLTTTINSKEVIKLQYTSYDPKRIENSQYDGISYLRTNEDKLTIFPHPFNAAFEDEEIDFLLTNETDTSWSILYGSDFRNEPLVITFTQTQNKNSDGTILPNFLQLKIENAELLGLCSNYTFQKDFGIVRINYIQDSVVWEGKFY